METQQRDNFFKRFLIPRRDYWVTPVILLLNLIMYLVVSAYDGDFWLPNGQTVIRFGGDTPALTLNGEWWRTLTACFLHFGFLHFASNMFALVQLGLALEKFVGSIRLAACYLFCGITGNVASNWWMSEGPPSVSAGASGAIFGLLGLFLALVTTEFVKKEMRWPLLRSIGGSVLLNLAISMYAHFNNAAHIGGLAAGIFSGYLIWILYKINIQKRELLFTLLMPVFSAMLILFVLQRLPKTAVQVNVLLERIEAEKEKVRFEMQTLLNNRQTDLADTLNYAARWDKADRMTDSLLLYKQNETALLYYPYFKKEVNLRRKETLLLVYIQSGYNEKTGQLTKVQQELKALLSEEK